MSDNKSVKIIQLYNRSITLLNLLRYRDRGTRDQEVAYQYNILRSEVKNLVNDPTFDRIIRPVWSFKPSTHIPIMIFVLGVMGVSLYYFWGLTGIIYSTIAISIIVFLILTTYNKPISYTGRNRGYWFLAGTTGQVADKLNLLQSYLKDYISINYPVYKDDFTGINTKQLKAKFEQLQQHNLGVETKLQQLEEYRNLELTSLRKRLMMHKRNLFNLEEEKAKLGFDLKLVNQIEDEKKAIEEIEKHINQLGEY